MFPLHTVYVVTLVSQGTSSLLLLLLAGSDRRIRGTLPLALACTLHTVAIWLMPHWRLANHWIPEALAAAILPLMFALVHRGLGSLGGRHTPVHRGLAAALALFVAVVVALAPFSQLWSMQIARCAGVLLPAPEVYPRHTGGQVDRPLLPSGLDHRRHQQIGSVEVLRLDRVAGLVLLEAEE